MRYFVEKYISTHLLNTHFLKSYLLFMWVQTIDYYYFEKCSHVKEVEILSNFLKTW